MIEPGRTSAMVRRAMSAAPPAGSVSGSTSHMMVGTPRCPRRRGRVKSFLP
jgi:hypothetical protein